MKRLLLSICFATAMGFAVWYGLNPLLTKDANTQNLTQTLSEATLLKGQPPLPEFSLIDTDEHPFSNQSLKGHWTLLFFGYASCPDVCPRALKTISEIYQSFSPEYASLKPRFFFISLDPVSDTPKKMREFLGRFNGEFKGLTGNELEMNKLAKGCRVFSITDPKLNPAGQKVIDHSAMLLLINPQGHLHAIFSPPHQPQHIAKDLEMLTKN